MRRTCWSVVAIATVLLLAVSAQAFASGITNSGDDLRDGWYPNSGITQQLVTGGSWGQLWSASVDGQVYAQPLYSNGDPGNQPHGTVVVATEKDNIYGLDPVTGQPEWAVNVGTPFMPATISCLDINPYIGTTSTPVIDPATNTVYFTYKSISGGSPQWYMDARNVSTGAEIGGWPVAIGGTAQDNPGLQFSETDQQQRPGLLLMNGVVYAGFGSHCDVSTWQGWVFGVSTTTHSVTNRWVDNANNASDLMGAGIWQAGTGLMSNASGQIYFSTGNGDSPATTSNGTNPLPTTFGNSTIHLQVQGSTLAAVDYFEPFDASLLDAYDADFGSGGVVGLNPTYFGTSSIPHLAVMVGKEGYVYLLNLDSLGGFQSGANMGDNVVQRLGPRGGVWGRPGVWPGDGGYIYITTSSGQQGGGPLDAYQYGQSGNGQPSLSYAGSSTDAFGWGSGPAVITSNGTQSGTAVVWAIWSANRQGNGGQLRAYQPVPDGNQHMVPIWSTSIGNATNYTTPGVGGGRLYVGTRDGAVLAFGSPITQPLTSSGVSFGTTTIGGSAQMTLTLTAAGNVTVNSLTSNSGQFTLGSPSPGLPAALSNGQQITVPVTFTPTQAGPVGGHVMAAVSGVPTLAFPLSGTGQAPTAQLAVNPALVSLGGTAIGGTLSGTATISNVGGTDLTINGFSQPSLPFTVTGLPPTPATIHPGGSINVNIGFESPSVGQFSDTFGVATNVGSASIGLSATAGTPGNLVFSTPAIDFGAVALGSSSTQSFTITNTGGTSVTIQKSKPPGGGAFTAITSLPEGLTIPANGSVLEQVSFTPTTAGAATGAWPITGNDGTGDHAIQFKGTGGTTGTTTPPPSGSTGATGATTPVAHPAAVKLLSLAAVPAVALSAHLGSTYIVYRTSEAGSTRFTLQRELYGRRSGGRCVAVTAANRHLHGCNRYVTLATFTHRDVAGSNRFRITKFVRATELTVGLYRLRGVPSAAGVTGATVDAHLRVSATAPPRTHRNGLGLAFSQLDVLTVP